MAHVCLFRVFANPACQTQGPGEGGGGEGKPLVGSGKHFLLWSLGANGLTSRGGSKDESLPYQQIPTMSVASWEPAGIT